MVTTLTPGSLHIDGRTVHYYEAGEVTGEPVVLLHGFSDSALAWRRLVQELPQRYHFVLVDAAGHGGSSAPNPGQFRSCAAPDVLAVVGALHLVRPVLIGHSMGAATAARVAATTPNTFRGVVLEDPPWRDGPIASLYGTPPPVGSRAPLRSPEWVAWLHNFQQLSPAEQRAVAQSERAEWPEIDRIDWAAGKARFQVDAIMAEPTIVAEPSNWRDLVRRFDCPWLLVTADVQLGGIVSPEAAREALTLAPRGTWTPIDHAGHNIRRSNFVPYLEAVNSFLATL